MIGDDLEAGRVARAELEDLRGQLKDLQDAALKVIRNWEGSELAGAVNEMDYVLQDQGIETHLA